MSIPQQDDVEVPNTQEVEQNEQNEPPPRITNNNEGNTEQKKATKRLSTYNEEVKSKRNPEEKKEVKEPEAVAEEPPTPQSTSSMSTSNIIAIFGLVATVGCLYYSYKTDKREDTGSDTSQVDDKPVPQKQKDDVKATPKHRTL